MKKITGVLSALLGAGLIASLTVNYCFYRKFSTPDPRMSQQVLRGKKARKYNKPKSSETVSLAELLARQKKKQEEAKNASTAIVSSSRFRSNRKIEIELNDSVSGNSLTPANLSEKHIRITPEIPFSLVTDYGGFTIKADFEPEKHYTVFIAKGLLCENGKKLKDDAEIRLKSPALPTRVRLLTNGLIFPGKRANRTLPLQISNADTLKIEVIRLYENNLGRYDINMDWTDSIEALRYGRTVAEKKIELKLPRNREVNYALDLNPLIPSGKTGVYGLILTPSASKKNDGDRKMAVVSVTDLAPQAVIDQLGKTAFAAVRKLSDSSPCAGAEVTLISRKFQTLASGRTDADGIVRLDYGKSVAGSDPEDNPDALLVKLGGDLVYYRNLIARSHSLAEFDTNGNNAQSPPRALVYTERGVYRPGEKVCMTAWLRNPDLSVYANAPCKLNVTDPRGNTIFSFPGKTDANGLIHTEFVLPPAGPGGYMDVVCLPAGQESDSDTWGRTGFLAADFMPDRIKVGIKSDKPVLAGSAAAAEFTFSAEYYFGGSLKDAPYRFAVNAVPAPKRPEWKDWNVGSRDFTPGRGISSRGKLKDSEVTCKYPGFASTGGKAACPVLLTASASVMEPGGRAVTANTSVICNPTQFYLGLQSESEQENVVFNWKFFPADKDSVQPLPKDQKIRLVFTRHEWKYVLKKGDTITREWVRENYPAGEAEIAAGDLTSGTFRHKLDNGSYSVTATCGEMRTDMEFWHWCGEGGARSSNPSIISCKLDKESYLPGETASVTLNSPADGAVLITLGDRKLASCRSFPVKSGSNTLKIALPAEADTSACYAGITLVTGENRQFGLVRIKLDQARHRLKVAIRAQETAVPQEKIKVGISLASSDGKPQKGMVQLYAVDEGILALTRYKTPDIFQYFYGAYGCDFLFCDIYGLLYPDLKIDKDGKIGGGEAMRATAAADLNRDPRRAAPESAVRVLPPFPVDGSAEVEIDLPDHLGAMRLMAVASAADRVGSADAMLKMRDKIDLMTTAPLVCAPGDETRVTFTMFNHDQPAGKMELSLDIPGMKYKEVRIVGKGKNLPMPVKIRVPDKEGLFTFTATLKKDNIVKKKTVKIPVRLPNPKITATYLRMLKPGEKWTPGKEIPQFASDARHQLTASSSSRAAIADALSWLNDYPYGCLEQTTSAAFPFLSTDALLDCGVISREMAATATAKKDRAAAKILSMMLYNGAFPMWQGGTEVWPGGTVFAAHFLTAGKYLTGEAQKRLLVNYLKGLAQDASIPRYERAYACYVLAAAGNRNMSTVTCARNLLDDRKNDYASFLAAAALIEAGYSGESWIQLKRLLEKEVWRNAGEVPYFMRETAVAGMTLYILMRIDANTPEAIAKLRQQLLGSLKPDGSGWGVTHSNAWAVLGLAELERRLPREKGCVTVTASDGKQFKPDTEKNEPLRLTAGGCTVENTGNVPVFVQYKVTGVPVKAEPVRGSLRLTRTYLRDGKPVTSAQHGDLLTVRLELDSRSEVKDLVISDLLPGGLEIEDERFATRAQGVPASRQDLKHFRAKHDEKRPGEFILSGTVTSPGKTVVTYQARAVSRGKYTLGSSSAEAMYEPELRAFEPGAGVFEVK